MSNRMLGPALVLLLFGATESVRGDWNEERLERAIGYLGVLEKSIGKTPEGNGTKLAKAWHKAAALHQKLRGSEKTKKRLERVKRNIKQLEKFVFEMAEVRWGTGWVDKLEPRSLSPLEP